MSLGGMLVGFLALAMAAPAAVQASHVHSEVMITPTLEQVEVTHQGKKITVQREQDPAHTIPPEYAKTSRKCPPFCIQPMHLAPGVETVGELEVLGYLKRINEGDRSIMIVDSRTPDWQVRGTIPGSVNIPWNKINLQFSESFDITAEAQTLKEILEKQFDARFVDDRWYFTHAKTLVLFCNGPWCPQSSINIRTLLNLGYPASKLKWYRGGMQDWVTFGLTTVKPGRN